jgi:hypothetical protein
MKRLKTTYGKIYTYSPCNYADIDTHYSIVAANVSDVDTQLFKDRMKICIDEGYAYKVESDDSIAFMYLMKYKTHIYDGVCFYNQDAIAYTILVSQMFMDDTTVQQIRVKPHNNNIKYLMPLANKQSIRKWHNDNTYPIKIVVSSMYKMFYKYYTNLNLTEL